MFERLTHRLLLFTLAVLLAVTLVSPRVTNAANDTIPCREFPETGFQICHGFLAFWNDFGGLPIFGYPMSNEMTEEGTVVQYFERARFEWHPNAAPSQHDVLLGRIGAEYSAGWSSLPAFQPTEPRSDARFFPATSHNVSGAFRSFWEEFGGVSLFGYPLSEAFLDHGITVQYFERARFELHPGAAPERQDVMLGLLGAELLRARSLETLASSLHNPRGIAVASDGTIYVAEAGNGGSGPCLAGPEGNQICFGTSGAVVRIAGSSVERIVTGLPSLAAPDGSFALGPQDVALGTDGTLYVAVGLGADPAVRAELPSDGQYLGQLLRITPDGDITPLADLAAYETANDPDGLGPDSNPFALLVDGDQLIVVDAGANTLLAVTASGEISTLAVFPTLMAPAPPFLNLPPGTEIPAQPVPTSIVKGADEAYYVSELTGFPFPAGRARLWRVIPGQAPEIAATGFTNMIDLTTDPHGNLIVLEITAHGLLAAQEGLVEGALGELAPDGTYTPLLLTGLVMPTAFAFAPDGSLIVTQNSTSGNDAQLVRVRR